MPPVDAPMSKTMAEPRPAAARRSRRRARVAGDGGRDRHQPLEERGVARERKRREGAPQHRPAVQERKAEKNEHSVHDPHVRGDGKRRQRGVEEDREARGAAEGQVVGRLEEHERRGREDEAHVEQSEELREAVGHALLGEPLPAGSVLLVNDFRNRLDGLLDLLVLLAHCWPPSRTTSPSARSLTA